MADHFASQVSGTQIRSFEDLLSAAGMTGDLLKTVLQEPRRAKIMVEALIRDLTPPVDGTAEKPAMPPRIVFEIAGRKYEAVSFVRAGANSVSGDEMIRRTDTENGGGLGEEDGEFLWEHRAELPEELKRHYLVFTKWRDPGNPRGVRCFGWFGGQWDQFWGDLDLRWNGLGLVVRRCT